MFMNFDPFMYHFWKITEIPTIIYAYSKTNLSQIRQWNWFIKYGSFEFQIISYHILILFHLQCQIERWIFTKNKKIIIREFIRKYKFAILEKVLITIDILWAPLLQPYPNQNLPAACFKLPRNEIKYNIGNSILSPSILLWSLYLFHPHQKTIHLSDFLWSSSVR